MDKSRRAPEWRPSPSAPGFAGEIMPGQPATVPPSTRSRPKRSTLDPDTAVEGIRSGNLAILARSITLVESNAAKHRPIAREILRRCLPHSGNSVRIGVTGVPGAGKSTFLECLGKRLCDTGRKIAVLAVDPSSTVSGGSVLGDKTRMEELCREPNAYIRPSPSSGALGGVAAKTRESMILCEAAGYDTIFVETVGVGQSEISVRSMVDFFLLLQIAGAGDELQGIKKGVIEMADAIAVNKADGDNEARAQMAKGDFERALHYLQPFTPGWQPQALCCSALTGAGIDELWQVIEGFASDRRASGQLEAARREQNVKWMRTLLEEAALGRFYSDPKIVELLPSIERLVSEGQLPAMEAVEKIIQ